MLAHAYLANLSAHANDDARVKTIHNGLEAREAVIQRIALTEPEIRKLLWQILAVLAVLHRDHGVVAVVATPPSPRPRFPLPAPSGKAMHYNCSAKKAVSRRFSHETAHLSQSKNKKTR